MPTDYVTDTHGLIWYLEDSPLLGVQAQLAFDICDRGECSIYIPTICLVEIIYPQEKGRIASGLIAELQKELIGEPNQHGTIAEGAFSGCPLWARLGLVGTALENACSTFVPLYNGFSISAGQTGLFMTDLTFEVTSALATIPRADVPDMPDRIITATALHLGLPLISRDRRVKLSLVNTIW